VNSWGWYRSSEAAGASVLSTGATDVAFGSLHRLHPGSGRSALPDTDTGLPAVIPAPTVRTRRSVRFGRGASRPPYRPQAPSVLGDRPSARSGLVPPCVRPIPDDRERPTGRTASAGPLGLAGRPLRGVVSRSYRPDRGDQLVPGTGSSRSHSGTDLRRSGDFGGRFTTSCCSRWPSPATAVKADGSMRAPATAEHRVVPTDRGRA
jgi:hypothetical protein